MLTSALVLVGSLLLMTGGAEALVRSASSLAFRLHLSPLFVGLTVVAAGTSAPELTSSVLAAARGSSDVAVGNVVGSNIFNVAVILGVAAVAHPIVVRVGAVRRDIVVACAVATIPWAAVLLGGRLPRWLGGAMVAALFAYTYAAFRAGRRASPDVERLVAEELEKAPVLVAAPTTGSWGWLRDTAMTIASLGALIVGAGWFITSAVALARAFEIPELTIGLTVVAAGTSMPELVTSTVAALRRQGDIAVGNVVGSNIFNVLGVLGVSTLVAPQRVPPQVIFLDVPVMLVASLALFPILWTGGRISRWEGVALLGGYALYVAVLLRPGGGS